MNKCFNNHTPKRGREELNFHFYWLAQGKPVHLILNPCGKKLFFCLCPWFSKMSPAFIMDRDHFLWFKCFYCLHGFLCRKSKPDGSSAEEACLSNMKNGSTDRKMFCNVTKPFEPDGITRYV